VIGGSLYQPITTVCHAFDRMSGAPEPVPNLVGGFDIVFDDQHMHLRYSPLGSQNHALEQTVL
jgi:hypothetical protein